MLARQLSFPNPSITTKLYIAIVGTGIMASGISPPPLKRRRLSPPSSQEPLSSGITSPPDIPTPELGTDNQSPPKSLRVYSWNVNGITPFLPPTTQPITNFLRATSTTKTTKPAPSQPSLRSCLHRWTFPELVCLQEVKLAPSDTKTPNIIRRAINTPLATQEESLSKSQLYDAYFCLPRDKYNVTGFGGKVYGVCTLIRQDLSPDIKFKSVEWDLEGRVQVIEIPTQGLILFNIYAVNGTTNDYRSPTTGKVIGTRHDRKRAFHSLLADEVAAYETKGWEVVVAGDINISRTHVDSFPQLRMGEEHVRNRADFEEKFIKEVGMVDTFRWMHVNARKYSYRPTAKPWGAGGNRVDMILVTKGLRESVKMADVLDSELERGLSDHVPLYVELEVKQNETNMQEPEGSITTDRGDDIEPP